MNKGVLSAEEIAEILKTDKESLKKFEDIYKTNVLEQEAGNSLFETNSRQASAMLQKSVTPDEIVNRIVDELLNITKTYEYDGKRGSYTVWKSENPVNPVTSEEILQFPKDLRPQFTGTLTKRDICCNSYPAILYQYKMWKDHKGTKLGTRFYHMFRQGLDILDLDAVLYEMIGMNPNSMGFWLPPLAEAAEDSSFFKIPKTIILKVPITLLQMTRNNYELMTPTTIRIINEYCKKVFRLDPSKEYFLKTGTYSSKFDFRNAYVHESSEVNEIGQYLLYIHYQALMMASPLTKPCIYGVSTTNEWVVREFIKDTENNPCIYKGLPLHTEYRLFVDFDTDKVIGETPYWRSDVMKQRFSRESDASSPHQKHDYAVYLSHEDKLMERYNENIKTVVNEMKHMAENVRLHGQWSVDIMQNGNDFYIIDMATASTSAFNDCIPKNLLRKDEENWIPKISV